MKIQSSNLGKRFRWEWIFRDMELSVGSGEAWAIYGPNGSGKSTLLKVLSGYLTPSEGKIVYEAAHQQLHRNDVFRHLAYAAPYTELIEEFTLVEMVRFHFTFKKQVAELPLSEIIDRIALRGAGTKQIRHFSSGMKQRVKLALAIMTDAELLVLDEPGTNLDVASHDWYIDLLGQFKADRTLLIASNEERDFRWCTHNLSIAEYKK